MGDFRLAVIGLDSSHAVEFPRLFQGDVEPESRVAGARVVSFCRFPSVFQSEEGQDARAKQLMAWGAAAAGSPEEAARDADGLLLTLNNPADHRPMMERLALLGKPIFLDKPAADTAENALAVAEAAKRAGIAWWSASAVPLLDSVARARRAVPAPERTHVYGPLGKAASGSDVVWYGCHTFETLVALLGADAERVRVLADDAGLVARVDYPDGRRGLVELIPGVYRYGGRAENAEASHAFCYDPVTDASLYANLVRAVRDFFVFGRTALPAENAMAAVALAVAVDRSRVDGGRETTVPRAAANA